jgi:crossover junction endodeoxyribonuclease RuvC
MIILGIDPGLASTGFGAIICNRVSPSLHRCGYVRTSPSEHISARLAQIHGDIAHLVREVNPDLVAMENVFSLVRYPKAGIMLGGVLGVIYLLVHQADLPIIEITPKEVKNALAGYGSANKEQIKKAVERLLHIDEVRSFHAADALAVALTAFYRKGTGARDDSLSRRKA